MADNDNEDSVSPENRQSHQEPDASDTAEQQVPLVPDENIKAPVKPAVDAPDIPDENRKEAQDAKKELLEDNTNNE